MVKRAILIAFAVLLAALQPAAAETVDISRYTERGDPVKVYISGITDSSGHGHVSAEAFKKVFESSIRNRRSVKFQIVDNPAASDFQISGVIKKYTYSKDDPINSIAGPSALLLDAATSENFAEMDVDFTVTSTGSGKVVWNSAVSDYVEQMMTSEESAPLVYDKVARKFLWKAFGKGK